MPEENDAARRAKENFLQRVAETLPSQSLAKAVEEPVNTQPSSLKLRNTIGIVGGDSFAALLGRYADAVPLSPHGDPAGVDWAGMDMLVLEGRILHHSSPWRRMLLDIGDEARALYRLIDMARRHGVPAVLWVTDEADATAHFHHLFDRVDLVVVPEEASETGDHIMALGPAADVKTFNPVTDNPYRTNRRAPLFGFLVDGAHEIGMTHPPEEAARRFGPLFDYNWWLTDSSFELRNHDQKVHPVMRRRFIGSKQGEKMATLLKYASAYILPQAMTERRPRHARRRHLEACAAKTCVMSDDPDLDLAHLTHVATPEDLRRICAWIASDAVGAAAAQHLAWRAAVGRHSWFEALETVLRRVGARARFNAPASPHVNVVVPTIRPEFIPFVLRMIDAQVHDNLSLTIVVNGVPVPDEIRDLVEARADTRLVSLPNDKSIGYCINYGVDQVEADYWAKIDDDDIYGPHYLSDMLLQRKYLDFDITGKGGKFTWFEENGTMHIRRLDNRDAPETLVGGGTLLVRAGAQPFPEDLRGYADTLFLLDAAEAGCRIMAADPFNFIQVRRADPTSHTWTAAAHELNLKGPQRQGLDFGAVLI